ncbi:MAG: hypothetical protein EBU88_18885 [Acidobacteria bacterium]|nr:hypothetical protein [Acidobacteriota bacterium]
MQPIFFAVLLTLAAVATSAHRLPESREEAIRRTFRELDRDATWRLVATIPLRFDAYHPQGMVAVGGDLFLSTVEVTRPTRRYPLPSSQPGRPQRLDRDEGAGVGHLFRLNRQGGLLSDLRIGDGSIYHPGGIDFDGRHIWIPVAEYRPNSQTIIYRVDPDRPGGLLAEEVCRFDDHLGSIVSWAEEQALVAVSWGARRIHRLAGCKRGKRGPAKSLVTMNPSFYIDYQDCHYLGRGEMICGGLRQYTNLAGKSGLSLGGLELYDLVQNRPIHQLPVEIWTDLGQPLTRNPFWIEPLSGPDPGLRGFFIPGDGRTNILVYEIRPGRRPLSPSIPNGE